MSLDRLFFGPTCPPVQFDPPLAQAARRSISLSYTRHLRLRAELDSISPTSHTPRAEVPSHGAYPVFDTPATRVDEHLDLLHHDLQGESAHDPSTSRIPLRRGAPTRLDAARVSIPAAPERVMSTDTVRSLLPAAVRTAVHEETEKIFFRPIRSSVPRACCITWFQRSEVTSRSFFKNVTSQKCYLGQSF